MAGCERILRISDLVTCPNTFPANALIPNISNLIHHLKSAELANTPVNTGFQLPRILDLNLHTIL